MIINRVWAMPNKWTFQIPPISRLIYKYTQDGKGWIDPFAGRAGRAEYTNDLNPDMPAGYHLDALEFVKTLPGVYQGVLFDPPYSLHQLKECYQSFGRGLTGREATNFYGDLRKVIKHLIVPGGIAISFGWNSIGMGKTHGFEMVEILLVCHGRAHNDTIVTVERKMTKSMFINTSLEGRGEQ